MSEENSEAIRSDAFVEVSYDDSIPNNVNLSSDKQCCARWTNGLKWLG